MVVVYGWKLAKFIKSSKELEKITVEKIPMVFSDMFRMVQSHQIDFAISGISATEKREQKYNIKFSMPYCKTRQAAIWIDPSITRVQDLNEKSFIVLKNTQAEVVAKRFKNAKVTSTRDNPKTFLLEKLIEGYATATISDYPTAIKIVEEYEKHSPSSKIKFKVATIHKSDFAKLNTVTTNQLSEEDFIDWYGIPIHKDQSQLINLVNKGIEKLRHEDFIKLQNIFENHQLFDKTRFKENPFELEWSASNQL